jgi:hypothetical protein
MRILVYIPLFSPFIDCTTLFVFRNVVYDEVGGLVLIVKYQILVADMSFKIPKES